MASLSFFVSFFFKTFSLFFFGATGVIFTTFFSTIFFASGTFVSTGSG
jgi:hypothetical protein